MEKCVFIQKNKHNVHTRRILRKGRHSLPPPSLPSHSPSCSPLQIFYHSTRHSSCLEVWQHEASPPPPSVNRKNGKVKTSQNPYYIGMKKNLNILYVFGTPKSIGNIGTPIPKTISKFGTQLPKLLVKLGCKSQNY